MLAAVVVHPDFREVLPLMPEPILKQDGDTKNDCERNAAKRLFAGFRHDHPRLPVMATGDGLTANAPLIRDLKRHNLRFLLGAKAGDPTFLFQQLEAGLGNGTAHVVSWWDAANNTLQH